MANTPASNKNKGRKFQQKVRDRILKAYPNFRPDDVRSTAMGQGGEDIQLSPYARAYFPFSAECKKHKSFAVYKPYEQAKANAPLGSNPILFIEGDRKEPLVVMGMEEFFIIMETIRELEEKS